jgi:4-amino-4-deoxy-L-arabinose transferase-like glycosyltransferase
MLAILNAVCWSLITPPFQGVDEPDHFAYVQELYETGRLPSSDRNAYSIEETTVLSDLHYLQVRQFPEDPAISSRSQQRALDRDLALPLSQHGEGDAGVAASEPPLYYALEMIPYALGSLGTELDRLQLMRLLSALFAGVTALFVFLFLREALPASRWAWTVGGLGAALGPLLGEVSGGVNPDALLYAVSAATFYCLARGFRRGLTFRLSAAIGALVATGLLTKLNFVGLVPGIFLGLFLLARHTRKAGVVPSRLLLPAIAIALSPLVPYLASNILAHHALLGFLSSSISQTSRHGSPLEEIAYVWQLYLPPLPGMGSEFPGVSTARQLWFDGLVGLYGWHDTAYPGWVYTIALIPAVLLGLLCIRALVEARLAIRQRFAELTVYTTTILGMLAIIGSSSYLTTISAGGDQPEPRYLLPLLALWGGTLTLAARGAGRRWRPVAGAAIVLLLLMQDISAQLLVISRYYL